MKKIQAQDAPQPIGAYSQAIAVSNLIFLSGQIPLNPQTMTIISEDFKEQTQQVFKNMQAVCKEANGDLSDIVKLTIYLIDLIQFPIVNAVMQEYFKDPFPARTTIQVSALPKGSQIEVDAIMLAK